MSLFRRAPAIGVTVTPATALPTDDVRAVVSIGEALSGVTAARVELGYVNSFNYHWAGRRDAAARHDDMSLATIGQVGTSYGSARTIEEWVPAISEELALMSGGLEAGDRSMSFRVPSWAPGSGEGLIAWAVRAIVERKGKDVSADGELMVLAPQPADVGEMRLERLMGDSCEIDVALERPCWKAGEAIRGTVTITPKSDVPEADVAVLLQRDRLSHPVSHTPSDGQVLDGDRIQLDKHLKMTNGVPTTLPFEIPLPADTPPTAEAVNSSYVWWVQVRILYKGLSSHSPERVRREFVVYNG